MDQVTVKYRMHSKAINNTGIEYLVNPNYFKQEKFRKEYIYKYLPADIMLCQRYNWFAIQIFRLNWINRKRMIPRFLLAILTLYLNPFKYYIWLRKRLIKSLEENEFYME